MKMKRPEIVWPIPEDGISHEDAVCTLMEIEAADTRLTAYEEDGNTPTGTLHIAVICENIGFQCIKYEELVRKYSHREFSFDYHGDKNDEKEKSDDAKYELSQRLAIMLVRAYKDWEDNHSKLTFSELLATPLPAVKPNSE
jgi:hypothetical protein